eukprot:COSAG06_NODE_51_length_28373_cov_30.746021_22_plen_64_part_01
MMGVILTLYRASAWLPRYLVPIAKPSSRFNTTFALNASVLLVKAVSEPSAENSAFHLPAHHVTS